MSRTGRFILRAEIQSSTGSVISYGIDLTPSSIFVVTDWSAPVGTLVSLRLSFPRVLEPTEVIATIESIRTPGAPGEFAGLHLSFGDECAPIRALLDDLRGPSPEALTQSPYRVLLVEDSGLIHDVFAHGLTKFFPQPSAFTVDHAESAEAAWNLLARNLYDLVIVDYFLPVEDGASLITRLRHDARLSQLPVVAISMGGRSAREATISAGADLFVDKPLVFRDVFSTLRMLWERRPIVDKKSILVLDDSPLALEITRVALESAGFEVAIAETLTAFEQQVASFDPDLILVDVQMPEAFGDDVAATLRARKGVRVPIILLSSIDETELALRAKEARAAGYIWKGAGTTELVRRCKELLGPIA